MITDPGRGPRLPSPDPAHPADLPERLDRWVGAGLISRRQATRIAVAEGFPATSSGTVEPRAPGSAISGFLATGRTGYVVEALGYLGGTLAAVAGFIAVNQLWPDIPIAAELLFAAAGALLLLGAGALVQAGADPALWRLRSLLWALSTGCLVAAAVLLVGRVWDAEPITTALVASSLAALYASWLWRQAPTPLQHLVLFAAVATAVATAAGRLDTDLLPWSAGLALWLVSAAWAALTTRALIRPVLTGRLAAAIGLLVGAQLTMEYAAGMVLAMGTVAALLGAGVVLRQVWLLGLGAFGVVQVVPQVASSYLPESVAAPLAVLAVGVVLLLAAAWLSRTQRPRNRERT